MKFIITGSGGCVYTPKPLCQCPVCVEARVKGYPYARCGCSLYLEDIAMLIDTPEDISTALNNADIREVTSILYSHWDPDHTIRNGAKSAHRTFRA
jgi:phosphoribosyl 1,2-cyclic phosphate phosphodiesterase